MKNRLFRSFFINKTDSYLIKEQEEFIAHDIEIINFKRMRLILIILLIIEILFIVLNDIPNLKNSGTNTAWSDKRYFVLHLMLTLAAFAGLIIIKLIKNHKGQMKKAYRIAVPGLTMIILILISIINGLDQIKIGNTGSVFIANILIFSAVLMIRFPVALLVYSVPFSIFIIGLLVFQKDNALLISNIINGTIFFAAVIIVSKVVYESHFIQMSRNIVLEEVNCKLDYMSNHDPLTGLSNRRYFEIQAKQKMDIMNQYGKEGALVIIDLDHFKDVNDQFGHPIGDMVLKEVSNVLLENIKDTDLATRWGGEEFLILFFQTPIKEAYVLSEKIRAAIENKIIEIDKFKIHVTASIGAAKMKGDFLNSFEAAYKSADQALYQAKNQGRNQVAAAYLTKEE